MPIIIDFVLPVRPLNLTLQLRLGAYRMGALLLEDGSGAWTFEDGYRIVTGLGPAPQHARLEDDAGYWLFEDGTILMWGFWHRGSALSLGSRGQALTLPEVE